jgi:DNA-directed RNA polymerase specialized sigma24 family protein
VLAPRDPRRQQFRRSYERHLAGLLNIGEPAAAAGTWDHFSPLVRGLLARALGPGDGIEDTLLRIFLRVHDRGGSLADSTCLHRLVVAVTVNQIGQELRKWRKPLARTGPVNAPRLALSALYRALDTLPPGQRLALTLHCFEDLEIAEAAALTRTSLGTFRRRLRVARHQLQVAAMADPWLSAYVDGGTVGRGLDRVSRLVRAAGTAPVSAATARATRTRFLEQATGDGQPGRAWRYWLAMLARLK